MDVVVVEYRTPDLAARAFRPSAAWSGRRVLVAVDSEATRAPPGVDRVDITGNPGFATAANLGAQRGQSPWILFQNPDCEPHPEQLEELLGFAQGRPDAAVVGPALVGFDGQAQRGGGADLASLRRLWDPVSRPGRGAVDWVAGTCMLVRRRAFEAVGGFDAGFFLYCEDADLCRRLRGRGWRCYLLGDVSVRHQGGAASAAEGLRRRHYRAARKRYLDKYAGRLTRLAWGAWQRRPGTTE